MAADLEKQFGPPIKDDELVGRCPFSKQSLAQAQTTIDLAAWADEGLKN